VLTLTVFLSLSSAPYTHPPCYSRVGITGLSQSHHTVVRCASVRAKARASEQSEERSNSGGSAGRREVVGKQSTGADVGGYTTGKQSTGADVGEYTTGEQSVGAGVGGYTVAAAAALLLSGGGGAAHALEATLAPVDAGYLRELRANPPRDTSPFSEAGAVKPKGKKQDTKGAGAGGIAPPPLVAAAGSRANLPLGLLALFVIYVVTLDKGAENGEVDNPATSDSLTAEKMAAAVQTSPTSPEKNTPPAAAATPATAQLTAAENATSAQAWIDRWTATTAVQLTAAENATSAQAWIDRWTATTAVVGVAAAFDTTAAAVVAGTTAEVTTPIPKH